MKLSPTLLKIGLLVGVLAFAVLVSEIALRVLGITYPRTTQADEVVGLLHRPGAKFWYRDEGEGWIECNTAGFRDVEWPVDKPSDEFRIAVLGDSYVEALQVPVEERFTEVVASLLDDQPKLFDGKHVRVMNFGMSGFGTGQELLLLRERVAAYQPDLVVLAFLTGNDVSDNSSAVHASSRRPYFVLRDGELVLDDSYRQWVASEQRTTKQLTYALADWSRLFQLANRVRHNLQVRAEMARVRDQGGEKAIEVGLDAPVYLAPSTPEWREAWEVTEALILAVSEAAKEQGAGFLLVTLSNSEQINPDPQERAKCMRELGASELTYPDDRIERFCQEHGIAVLKLAPLLLAYAESHNSYLHGFSGRNLGRGHWNALGHKVAGELIAQKIIDQRRHVLGLD